MSHSDEEEALDAAVGEQLRRYRVLANFSRAELAKRSGVSDSTIKRIEWGKRGITLPQLVALSRALHVRPTEFVDMALREIGE